jgi:hypothetical protein
MKLPEAKNPKKYVYREFVLAISDTTGQNVITLDAIEEGGTGMTIAETATGGYRVKKIFVQKSTVATYDETMFIGRGAGTPGGGFVGNMIGFLNLNEGGMDFEENAQGNNISTKETIIGCNDGTYMVKIGIEYVAAIDETYTITEEA